jgi:hypothetical protein
VTLTRDTVVLSSAEPRQVVPVDLAAIPMSAAVVEVPVVRIENEALAPFTIRLRLVWGDADTFGGGQGGVVLGAFSVYPPDRSGRYMLGVSDELRTSRAALAARPQSSAALVLELQPVAPAWPQGRALRVHIAPVVWRGDP